jgi:NADPH-dependent FMN reductase.
MKIIKTIFAAFALALSLNACASKSANDGAASQPKNDDDMKAVIVYFTHSGNTELAAKNLNAVTGAMMVRMMPEQPYSAEDVDWVNEQSRCTREHLDQSLRPAIKPVDVDFAKVDTVFIGFPIWWHEEPAVIRTFLDDYKEQLKGKVLYPFCTSYESPMSEADATLRKNYPDYNWKTGLRFPAKSEQIKDWIAQ